MEITANKHKTDVEFTANKNTLSTHRSGPHDTLTIHYYTLWQQIQLSETPHRVLLVFTVSAH